MKLIATAILILSALNATAQQQDTLRTEPLIYITDPMPTYPGGDSELKAFIKKNLKYPKKTDGVKGKVFVQFIVSFVQFIVSNEDGSLSEFKVMKGLGFEFDKNAIEVLKKMPNFIPPTGTNLPTHTRMVLPVIFDR